MTAADAPTDPADQPVTDATESPAGGETRPPAPVAPPPGRTPVVAIVGRPNVGKSSLLNALAGKRVSIVQDEPGITRDRVSVPYEVDGRFVELVDTGGYGFVDPDDLTDDIRRQVEEAMRRSDLVVFVVDAQTGPIASDAQVAALLREQSIPTVLVGNKADGEKADLALGDFASLGLGTPVGVSAIQRRNLDAVPDAIRRHIDLSAAPTEEPAPDLRIAIVGKRNAGKSTFVNAVARAFGVEGDDAGDRVIVSEIPGTTRDSVDVAFTKDGRTTVVIDTAGVRKKRHMVNNDTEFYSYHRAQRSVRRADVVLLLIDATEKIAEPDKKLARYVADELKPVIVVLNKWDLALAKLREQRKDAKVETDDRALLEEYRTYVDLELPFLTFAPVAFVTAKDGRNVASVLDQARRLARQSAERVSTGRLNAAVKDVLQERPPNSPGGRKPKVYYATQVSESPPTIVLFVNDPKAFTESYRRMLSNRFRDLLPFAEVPFQLHVRPRTRTTEGDDNAEIATDRPIRKRPIKSQPPKGKRSGPNKQSIREREAASKGHKR